MVISLLPGFPWMFFLKFLVCFSWFGNFLYSLSKLCMAVNQKNVAFFFIKIVLLENASVWVFGTKIKPILQ